MAIRGRRPKPSGHAVTRNRRVHDWLEVEDRPNLDGPDLPPRRRNGRSWPAYARNQWQAWSAMPHTTAWTPSDWAYAIDSLELVVRANAEGSAVSLWSELRIREAAMGCTWGSRQSLRLRYIPAVEDSGDEGSVASL